MEGTAGSLFLEFMESLEGQNFNRIRSCPKCEQIYWASRKDQSACSKRHAAIIRTQKSQEKAKNKDAKKKTLKKEAITLVNKSLEAGRDRGENLNNLIGWNMKNGEPFTLLELEEICDSI